MQCKCTRSFINIRASVQQIFFQNECSNNIDFLAFKHDALNFVTGVYQGHDQVSLHPKVTTDAPCDCYNDELYLE
jgi:hypothetical protein